MDENEFPYEYELDMGTTDYKPSQVEVCLWWPPGA